MNRSRYDKSNERTRRARREARKLDAINEEWSAAPFSIPTAILVFQFCREMTHELGLGRKDRPQ